MYDELRQRRITGYMLGGTGDKVTAERWIIEQILALPHRYRCLAIRRNRTDKHHRQGLVVIV